MSDVVALDSDDTLVQRPQARRRSARASRQLAFDDDDVVCLSDGDGNRAPAAKTGARRRAPRASHRAAPPAAAATAPRAGRRRQRASSPDAEPTASLPKAKRQRNKKATGAAEQRINHAGRVVRTFAQPSQQVLERIARALPGSAHRMFLISSSSIGGQGAPGGPSQEFAVLGASGNVYDVTISPSPCCSCPDFKRPPHLCKHMLFVMLRVLKVQQQDPVVWQRGLLRSEVEEVLGGRRPAQGPLGGSDVAASERVKQAYEQRAAGEASGAGAAPRHEEGADCPVCFEELQPARSSEPCVWCRSCGNGLHTKCLEVWAATKRRQGVPVTCVLCRATWQDERSVQGSDGGYVNLAAFSPDYTPASTSLEALYGARAAWIPAGQGSRGRGRAPRVWVGR